MDNKCITINLTGVACKSSTEVQSGAQNRLYRPAATALFHIKLADIFVCLSKSIFLPGTKNLIL